MDHTNKEILSAFIDNKLIGKIKIEVINHLRQCEECRLLMSETSLFIDELKKSQSKNDTVAVNSTTKNVYKMLYKYLTPLALAASVVLVLQPIIHIQDSHAPQMTSIKDINAYNEGVEATAQTPTAQEMSKESSVIRNTEIASIPASPAKSTSLSAVPVPVESSQPAQLAVQAPVNAMRSTSTMPKSVSYVLPMKQFVSDDSVDSGSAALIVATLKQPAPTPVAVSSIASEQPVPTFMATEPIILDPVYFKANKLSITDAMQKQIRKNIAKLKYNNMMSYAIRLEGHSDNAGTEQYNYVLSLQRAEHVKNTLIAEGLEVDQVSTTGFGNAQPECIEKTPECKAKNNRVEFILHIY